MSSKYKKQGDEKKGKPEDILTPHQVTIQKIVTIGAIFVAAISAISTITVAFIQANKSSSDAPTLLPVVATVLPADTPTFTPSPVPPSTETPAYPCTFLGTCKPGDDWQRSCISDEIWDPYLVEDNLPQPALCYDLSEWGIFADEGELALARNATSNTAHEYGIFTRWQNWQQVNFSLEAERLNNGEIWFGFLNNNTLNAKGIVFVVQEGDMIDMREMPSGKELVNNAHLKLAEKKYNAQVVFQKGEINISVDGQNVISSHPVNFTIRTMFIGYRAFSVTDLEADIYNLKFMP